MATNREINCDTSVFGIIEKLSVDITSTKTLYGDEFLTTSYIANIFKAIDEIKTNVEGLKVSATEYKNSLDEIESSDALDITDSDEIDEGEEEQKRKPPREPDFSAYEPYVVQKGDSLYKIAKMFNVNESTILNKKGISITKTKQGVHVGEEIYIPKQRGSK